MIILWSELVPGYDRLNWQIISDDVQIEHIVSLYQLEFGVIKRVMSEFGTERNYLLTRWDNEHVD